MSLVFALILVSAQAAAADAQPVAPPEAAAEAPKKVKEKKICKLDEATSGTRMTKRLCLTEEEWANRSKSMYESARSGTTATAQDH
jgi:predicted secreted protein